MFVEAAAGCDVRQQRSIGEPFHRRVIVAERIARRESVYPGLPRGAVRRALEALRDAGIIDSGGRADWRFSNPLLRRYLQAMAPFN